MNILNKLTRKHLLMNKKRTIVTIVGIILSTSLMVGIGLLLSTFREGMIENIITYSGDYNARIDDLSKNNIQIINNNPHIKSYITRNYLGYDLNPYNEETISYFKAYSITTKYMEHLKVIDGRLPLNSTEVVIPKYLYEKYRENLQIGNNLKLSLGNRYLDNSPVSKLDNFYEGEYLDDQVEYQFTIVGIIEKDYYEDNDVGCYIYTTGIDNDHMDIFINYKQISKTYDLTETLAKSLGITNQKERVSYNTTLLALYGASSYDNLVGSMVNMMVIMLFLVSIACVIVIYNSFAISVMERKKQFGLFSSIGATKLQIKRTVLYEAFIVSLIGIPLGILCSYIGISIVTLVMDNLISDIVGMRFHLTTYPLFLIIPIIFITITIFISALLPAKKASKISPIEAIRLNDEIKIKSKKVKSPKIIKYLFGIEGDLAYKNMKRNKKKYRITVISLFISIVLFISFSGYSNYLITSMNSYLAVPEVDIIINYDQVNSDNQIIDKIKNHEQVSEYMEFTSNYGYTNTDITKIYSDKYLNYLKEHNISIHDNNISSVLFVILNNDSYQKYLKLINQKEPLPILYNKFNTIEYSSNSRKSYLLSKYNTNSKIKEINIQMYTKIDNDSETQESNYDYQDIFKIKDYYISDNSFVGLDLFSSTTDNIIIVSEDYALENGLINLDSEYQSKTIYITAPKYKDLDNMIKEYQENGNMNHIYYQNIKEEVKMMHNFMIVVKMLVYGFITLVTLIGVTSVFNTINTGVALRRKEFAVLRSIGLTPKGFNKILRFESLFYGLKSLFFALPVSFGIIYLMHLSMRETVEIEGLLIPWKSILIAIILVFVIITISMFYATKKVKKDNILDTIREENI